MNEENKNTYTLKPEEELRFEVDFGRSENDSVKMILTQGTAEIFGTEISQMKPYIFPGGSKLAIYTFSGCTLEMTGVTTNAYVASEAPMSAYYDISEQLEKEREQVNLQNPNSCGPRVLICGAADTGKSSLSKILINYATRLKSSVLFADLDVGQGEISIPGTLSIATVNTPIDIMEGFSLCSPLTYFFGYNSPDKNIPHYKMIVERVAEMLEVKTKHNPEFRRGGYIVNTCGWIEGAGYQLLTSIIQTLKISHVLVMGDDRLTNNLKRDLQPTGQENSNITITRLQKSGGVVNRSTNFRRLSRMQKIREYFNGTATKLSYHSIRLKFDEVQVFRVGNNIQAPAGALPIGEQSNFDPTQPREIPIVATLNSKILAVSHANVESEIPVKNVAGFVHVTGVDMDKREITVSAPSPGKIPKKFLILASLEWLED
ncbi:mRNA cleavage and polyadenylation factor CLP1 [Acrasis kona]|uniref:Protein CLP1 homolog n=1 Tax=Acrasis kona TaxID=1008807 RepID=A0AAW2Z3B3_9EUKA